MRQIADLAIPQGTEKLLETIENSPPVWDEKYNPFFDDLIELMAENEKEIDSIEIECLSSYGTTSTFILMEFAGIYTIRNWELGDLLYFSSLDSAKSALHKDFGIDWNHPEERKSQVATDELDKLL